MSRVTRRRLGVRFAGTIALLAMGTLMPKMVSAQAPPMPPDQLGQLVGRIALYPDPLLAQVLSAATYPEEIPEAAGWANQHRYLTGEALARAIQEDNLPWDTSVLGLLPFPSVLDMMARDMNWTHALGDQVLANRPAVMDAIQDMRARAQQYGYLQNNPNVQVMGGPGGIEIMPVDPGFYYVPVYDPFIVFARPRPGFFVGAGINWGPRIYLGAAFAPWGWRVGGPAFEWRSHTMFIDRQPWGRTWGNRGVYVHPYAVPRARVVGPRVERHEFRGHEEERRRP